MAPPAVASAKGVANEQASGSSNRTRALQNGRCIDAAKVSPMCRKLQPCAMNGRYTRQCTLSKVFPHGISNGREVPSSSSTTKSSKGRKPHGKSPKPLTGDNVPSQGLMDWKHLQIAHSLDAAKDKNR